ncbi:galactose oxidase [Paenibacillus jilunlii]|uniref:Galactose oxidase n=1 Tax=Paenibacillus jilunlii TaxID=682956 RepID=A0ABR5SSX9_9BACL|nr:galactose oxidase [Paenibacillus jilunlii]
MEWYDARDAGSGPAQYVINKHDNNKGPFSKRKDYVVFDKILTIEVNEYTAQ